MAVQLLGHRKDDVPIDPSPWWVTNEDEKVRG
jgi:hypothetical protein